MRGCSMMVSKLGDELDEMAKGKKSFGFGDKGSLVCVYYGNWFEQY